MVERRRKLLSGMTTGELFGWNFAAGLPARMSLQLVSETFLLLLECLQLLTK